MLEAMPQDESNPGEPIPQSRNDEILSTRHSQAKYGPYGDIIAGPDPEQPMNYADQEGPDLTEAGIKLAQEKAVALFAGMAPESDALFFVASPERRTLETAAIYRQVAKERGFEVLAPGHVGPENKDATLAESIGEGEVRLLETLSTNIENTLVGTVFNPEKLYHSEDVNWEAVNPATKEKFEQAREIIKADDKGSWGANFFSHSEEIAELFPDDMKTAQDLYEQQFKNLIRLARFGMRKIQESGIKKNVKILAFGHESYFCVALEKYFGDHAMANCETVTVRIGEDDAVTMERRGAQAALEE